MGSGQVIAAVGALSEAFDALAELSVDTLTHPELLSELETVAWTTPTIGRTIIARLQREASPTENGAKSLKDVLCRRLRISAKDATLRLAEAKDLGPRTAFSGEPMDPVLSKVAAAQAAGAIGPDHVAVIRAFHDKLPIWVDVETREKSEGTLVDVATGFGPDELRKAAERLAALIDQDGPEPDDAERARKRSMRLSRQEPDGMSKLTGDIDPQLRATWEPLLAKPGSTSITTPNGY